MTEFDIRKDAQAKAKAEAADKDAQAAADGLTTRPGVKEHYEEMTEIGANAKGEGRIP